MRARRAGRNPVEVVALRPERVRELTGLWLASRVDAGVSPEAAARSASEGRLLDALQRPDVRAHLALIDGVSVGYVITTENPFGLGAHPETTIEQLYVDHRVRRHGVARALLTTVLGQAERGGSEIIVSNVPATLREANRFFARLGFSSVIVRRVAATTALRRRLTPQTAQTELTLLRRRRLVGTALRESSQA